MSELSAKARVRTDLRAQGYGTLRDASVTELQVRSGAGSNETGQTGNKLLFCKLLQPTCSARSPSLQDALERERVVICHLFLPGVQVRYAHDGALKQLLALPWLIHSLGLVQACCEVDEVLTSLAYSFPTIYFVRVRYQRSILPCLQDAMAGMPSLLA